MENHVRGLESLGRSHETYGDLLVPMVLGKLPSDMSTNLARDHDGPEWKFQQLRESILKEIWILEVGVHTNLSKGTLPGTSTTVTNSFFTQARGKPPNTTRFRPPETRGKCAYCKGHHPAYNCRVITDCQERWAIVKREQLCFNCLGSHKSSACQSRHHCHKSRRRHHTSLCAGQPPVVPNPTLQATNQRQPSVVSKAGPQTTDQRQQPPISHINATLAPVHSMPPSSTPAHVGQTSLLKTAVAIVCTDYIGCEANILFDEGAQRSFITCTLANQLGLDTSEREDIHLSNYVEIILTVLNFILSYNIQCTCIL